MFIVPMRYCVTTARFGRAEYKAPRDRIRFSSARPSRDLIRYRSKTINILLLTEQKHAASYLTTFLTSVTKSSISSSVVSNEVINRTSEISSFQT